MKFNSWFPFRKYSKSDTIVFYFGLFVISILILRYFGFYSSSSLFTDEIYTIEKFSSKGPMQVMTDYRVPNNHIFFNLINSILPLSDSYDPLRARMVSFVSFLIFALLTYKFLVDKGFFIEANVLMALILASPEMMRMLLEARGYGLLFLINTIITIKSYRYLESNKNRDLWVIGLCCLIGTWTLPSYVFFVVSYFIGFLILSKNKKGVFIAGAITSISIFLAYLPVLKELLTNMETYAADWGEEFAQGQAIFQLFKLYTPVSTDWQALIGLALFNMLPFIFIKHKTQRKFITHLFLLIYLCLGSYIFMRTPVLRTAMPLIFSVYLIIMLSLGSFFLRNGNIILKGFRHGIHLTALISAVFFSFSSKLIPFENWKGTAEYIESNFDESVEVYCNFRPFWLEKYLDPKYKIASEFDSSKFKLSQQVYVDSHFFNYSNRSQTFLYGQNNIGVQYVPQVRGNYQLIHFNPKEAVKYEKETINYDQKTLKVDCCNRFNGQSYEFAADGGIFNSMFFDVDVCGSTVPICEIILEETEGPSIFHSEVKLHPEKRRYFIGKEYFSPLHGAKLENVSKLTIRIKFMEEPACNEIVVSNVQIDLLK